MVALVLGCGACASRPGNGPNCAFDGPGLAAVLSQVDASSHDAAPVTEDAGAAPANAQGEGGCVDGRDCPTGMVLFMATYSAPCTDRRVVCRKATTGDRMSLSGEFTRADVDAIATMIARVDRQPLLSIDERDNVAVARTGCAPACLVNGGWLYRLRKANGAWIIVERSMEIE